MTDLYEPDLLGALERAAERLGHGLDESSPPLAAAMAAWLNKLTGSRPVVAYFTHLRSFPIMLFPWWVEARMSGSHDLEFQEDLALSSFCGYLYIRLIDDVMDEPGSADRRLLPLANYFQAGFQSAYFKYFPADDGFWRLFHRTWTQSAEAAFLDAGGEPIDERRFLDVSARKTCAGKIPLAAVCRRFGLKDAPEPWLKAFDRTAAFHQMFNDLFDFQRDLETGAATYFLSEGMRRKGEGETTAGWVIREGFDWGLDRLNAWLEELARCAEACGSQGLKSYVALRADDLRRTSGDLAAGIQNMKRLLEMKP